MRRQPYTQYKRSQVEWLEDIPEHWRLLKIKRLSRVKRGASPRPIDDPKYFDDTGEYSWVRIADVTASNNYLLSTTQRLSELGKSLSVPLEPGEIFLSIAGSVGKPIITGIKCCIHDGFVYFPDYKQDKKFLYYVFASGQPYLGLGKLGTQLNLNTDTVGDVRFGLPPLPEQHAIASFLDREMQRIDTLIAKKERQIELLQEKRAALISHFVTKGLNPNAKMKDSGIEWIGYIPEHWDVIRLKYAFVLFRGFDLASDKFIIGPFPVCGSNGIIGYHDQYTTVGPSITVGRSGSVGEVNFYKGNFWAHNTALYVKDFIRSDPRFTYYLLKTLDLKSLSAGSAVGTLIDLCINNGYNDFYYHGKSDA